MLIKAIAMATHAHRNQRRKASEGEGEPYIGHPVRVMRNLSEFGVTDLDILAAAVLHDTVEDTNVTLKAIERGCNQKVSQYVAELTKSSGVSRSQSKKAVLENAGDMSVGAKLIKRADMLDNLYSLDEGLLDKWTVTRTSGYAYWLLAIFRKTYGDNMCLDVRVLSMLRKFIDVEVSDEMMAARLKEYYQELDALQD